MRQAIIDANAAAGEDTITFSTSGTITLTNGQILITDDLVISGPGASALTISGNNSSRIFQVQEESSIALDISGLTLQDGYASQAAYEADESLDIDGGAIHVKGDSSLTISDSVITANRASGDGGGVSFESTGNLLVRDSVFSENSAGHSEVDGDDTFYYGDGGAIDVDVPSSYYSTRGAEDASDREARNGTDEVEEAKQESGASPAPSGTMSNAPEQTIVITGTEFTRNSTFDDGGAIHIDDGGSLSVHSSIFTENSAQDDGGAIDHHDGISLSISASTFEGNYAGDDGGGVYADDLSFAEITDSSFTGNVSGDDGGGLQLDEVEAVTIHSSSFTSNDSGMTAAVWGLTELTT